MSCTETACGNPLIRVKYYHQAMEHFRAAIARKEKGDDAPTVSHTAASAEGTPTE